MFSSIDSFIAACDLKELIYFVIVLLERCAMCAHVASRVSRLIFYTGLVTATSQQPTATNLAKSKAVVISCLLIIAQDKIMPIDPLLLRKKEEGGIPDEIIKSQILRLGSEQTDAEHLRLVNFQQLEIEKRNSLRELNNSRTKLKKIQKELAPGNTLSDSEIRHKKDEGLSLKTDAIPRLQDRLNSLTFQLDQQLFQFSNLLDETDFECEVMDYLPSYFPENIDLNVDVTDILFCLGGYEKLTIPALENVDDSGLRSESKVVLSGIGTLLSSGVVEYCKHFFQMNFKERNNDISLIRSPQIDLPRRLIQATLGSVAHTDVPRAPSYLCSLMLKADACFSDKTLPSVFLCQSECTRGGKYTSTHPLPQLEILYLVSSDLNQSRVVQDTTAKQMLQMYTSLIGRTDYSKKVQFLRSSIPPIRVQLAKPSELNPNESRRLNIEGYIKSRNEYVILGFISNTTDFLSRELKMKFIGSHTVEYVHIIHGMICSDSIIDWILDQNLARLQLDSNSVVDGVFFTPSLCNYICLNQDGNAVFMPFKRLLVKGKKAKTIVQDIPGQINPIILENSSKTSRRHRKNKMDLIDGTTMLTKKEIVAESSCNPYGFLPFLHRT